MKNVIGKYLARYGEPHAALARAFFGETSATFRHVVTIPACGESTTLPRCLRSLAEVDEAQTALAVVVINDSVKSEYNEDNQRWFARHAPDQRCSRIFLLNDAPLTTLVVNCTAPAAPQDVGMGVGTARKIGGDVALALQEARIVTAARFFCSDADVTFPCDYLTRWQPKSTVATAVFPFHHVNEDGELPGLALCLYEIYLRFHELQMRKFASPFAFQVLGSTLAITSLAYAAARGFPKVDAGEDFHILQKLCKSGPVEVLDGEPLQIHERPSLRVPFGTGASCAKIEAAPNYHIFPAEFYCAADATLRCLLASPGDLSNILRTWFPESAAAVSTAVKTSLRMDSWQQHCARMQLDAEQTRAGFYRHVDGLAWIKLFHIFEAHGLQRQPWRASLRTAEDFAPYVAATPEETLVNLRFLTRQQIPRAHSL